MYCPKCGQQQISDEMKFCSRCGLALSGLADWLAGGGVRAGHVVGATDDIGRNAVDSIHHVKDLHCTILHLLGLDDNKLTYFHEGRYKQLSQTGGSVIKELLA